MVKKFIAIATAILLGIATGATVCLLFFSSQDINKTFPQNTIINTGHSNVIKKEVIGFMPFWLVDKAQNDYSMYINNFTYFSLVVDKDGSIQKFTKPNESEPGYLALMRGKIDPLLSLAKQKDMKISVAVFSGNDDNITEMLNDPEASADNLTNDILPIMKDKNFSDLNLDIEQVMDASPEARLKYTNFVKKVRGNMNDLTETTLSIDVIASTFVKTTNLVDIAAISPYVDKVIIMAYDYHHIGSFIAGPVAPAFGGGSTSEYDAEIAIKAALTMMQPEKIILGIPLYGYEWETITSSSRSPTIPTTGLIISNQRAEEEMTDCSTCVFNFDATDAEMQVTDKNENGTYRQIFYPTDKSTQAKVDLANKYKIGGIALWALGYEGKTILQPLSGYRN